MDKRFLAILGGIIAVFIGIFVVTSGSDNGGQTNGGQKPTSHIKGEGAKNVTLIEYGDYQCPVCALYEPTLQEVYNRFSKDIYFQFRNLPLTIHQNAFAAARAAEAAGLQNKYWEMHDKLYQNQNDWANSSSALSIFRNYAKEIGLDVDKFATDYASSAVNAAINADVTAFKETGQDMATPTFFINGRYVPNREFTGPDGAPSVDRFAEIINAEINKR